MTGLALAAAEVVVATLTTVGVFGCAEREGQARTILTDGADGDPALAPGLEN
jgi:hypothetical protein